MRSLRMLLPGCVIQQNRMLVLCTQMCADLQHAESLQTQLASSQHACNELQQQVAQLQGCNKHLQQEVDEQEALIQSWSTAAESRAKCVHTSSAAT